jgi:hypothetical protein
MHRNRKLPEVPGSSAREMRPDGNERQVEKADREGQKIVYCGEYAS